MTHPSLDSLLLQKNEGVYTVSEPIVKVSQKAIEQLKGALAHSAKARVRICAHPSAQDGVHEMIIALAQGSYIQPHRHLSKSESFHLIEGELDIIIFDEAGKVAETIRMGTYDSGLQFYYRMNASLYHTVIVRTSRVIFHETTTGPFVTGDAEFASWAPKPDDQAGVHAFLARF